MMVTVTTPTMTMVVVVFLMMVTDCGDDNSDGDGCYDAVTVMLMTDGGWDADTDEVNDNDDRSYYVYEKHADENGDDDDECNSGYDVNMLLLCMAMLVTRIRWERWDCGSHDDEDEENYDPDGDDNFTDDNY